MQLISKAADESWDPRILFCWPASCCRFQDAQGETIYLSWQCK